MRSVTVKSQLDATVAVRLGKRPREVSKITSEFLVVLQEHLVELETVRLDGFGEMNIVIRKGARKVPLQAGTFKPGVGRPLVVNILRKYHVSFRKSAIFKAAITARHGKAAFTEPNMDKYGVNETGTEQEKKAQAGCPGCGSKVERHGNVLICPKCGTAPFEGQQK